MISETMFAAGYTSLWRLLTPNSDRVVKQLNQTVQALPQQKQIWSQPDRRAFINEMAFWVFIERQRRRLLGQPAGVDALFDEGVGYAMARQRRFKGAGGWSSAQLTALEQMEVSSLVRVLEAFRERVARAQSPIHLRPRFKGCGILDACEADLVVGGTLVEVKAGDRSFRAIDIRQILTYCALDRLEGKFGIASIAGVNPRLATYFEVDLETLCLQLASKPASELLAEIAYFLSSGDMSR